MAVNFFERLGVNHSLTVMAGLVPAIHIFLAAML
jgi:hypothetical protein